MTEANIHYLPSAAASPETLLHQVLETSPDLKAVIVLSVDAIGNVSISTSRITLFELAYASLRLQCYAQKVTDGGP